MTKETIQIGTLDVSVKGRGESRFISLTDIARKLNADAPSDVVKNWMRTRFAIEYMGLWEKLNNPNANIEKIQEYTTEAGSNLFTMSPTKWIENVNAIGITSTMGRNANTYAHSYIAFEFASWISAEFKLYLVMEFQRLKSQEQTQLSWDAKRELARINYHIQTDAIQDNLILPKLTPAQKNFVYADEADLLNVVMFGKTARQWRDENKIEADNGENIRDYAKLDELLVLANLQSHNASFIEEKLTQEDRLERLRGIAERELKVLQSHRINAPLLLDTNKKENK